MDEVHILRSEAVMVEATSTNLDELTCGYLLCDAATAVAGGMSGKQQTPCVLFVLLSIFVSRLSQPEGLGVAYFSPLL